MQVRVKYLCSYILYLFATTDKKVRYLRQVICKEKTYQRVSCGESFSAIVLGIARLLDDHRAMRLVHDPAAMLVHDPGVHDPGARLVRDHGSRRQFIAPAQDTRQVPPVPQKPGQQK